jgi:positive regulator of sigma E activity
MKTLVIIVHLICAFICASIAEDKGYSPAVAAIGGFLIGVGGVIIYACLKRK